MAGSAPHDDRGATQTLHVLIVDEDTAELGRTGLRLLEAGYVVSMRRGAEGLLEHIARLRPDLILLDPLLIGLDFAQLSRFCRTAEGPAIVLHTKVLPRVLHGAISFKDVLGVIHKADDEQDFEGAFRELSNGVPPRSARGLSAESFPPAASGTHLIGATHALPFERSQRRGQ